MSPRSRKAPLRLGQFAPEAQVEDALELDGSELEDEAEGEVQHSHKAARRAGPARTAVTADAISGLLAGAPALVDLLIQEDAVRCITLVARDVINLSLAAGGRVVLEPVWEVLATRIKNKAAAEAAAAAAAVADRNIAGNEGPAAALPTRKRHRMGHAAAAKPAEPAALEVVQTAVAADPARTSMVKKSETMWRMQLSNMQLQGMESRKGRWGAAFVRELDIRAVAHRKHGDEVQLEASKAAAIARKAQARETYQRRRQEEMHLRKEELVLRLAEARLPSYTNRQALQQVAGAQFWSLQQFVEYGRHGGISLTNTLAPIIQQEAERRAQGERESVLDERLKEEGLLARFKRDWRYRCFIDSGLVEEVGAVLEVARRQEEARRAALERILDLEDRLDAAGLSCLYCATSPLFDSWVGSGEGNIEGQVAELAGQMQREVELVKLLELNGLMYRRTAHRCRQFILGKNPSLTAGDVVKSLLRSLAKQHKRSRQLLDRLSAERLPADVSSWAAKVFIREGTGSINEVVAKIRDASNNRFIQVLQRSPTSSQPSQWRSLAGSGKNRFAFYS